MTSRSKDHGNNMMYYFCRLFKWARNTNESRTCQSFAILLFVVRNLTFTRVISAIETACQPFAVQDERLHDVRRGPQPD
jgi:hypothetical protein